MTREQRQQARELANAGVRTGRIMDVMLNQHGGYEYVGFKIRNLYNYLHSDVAELVRDGDANTMLAYIASKVQTGGDKNLYCRYTVDEEDRLCHLFWADSKSRQDYHCYKEVVVFDATYNLTKYGLPLVLIVGVNNHNQTVLFGSALMRDENAASYTWLLETFMDCMKVNHGPPLVITDSDAAMIKAISMVWPLSLHRLCYWHIMRNFKAYVESAGFKEVFIACIVRVKNMEEFQSMWDEGIEEFDLSGNTWLKHMYEQKDKWAQFRFASVFSAHQTTTQRCESINAYFKRWIDKHVCLTRLMMSHDEAVLKLRENELEQDVICKDSKPSLIRGLEELSCWMDSAHKQYTREIYKIVMYEIKRQLPLIASLVEIDSYLTAKYEVLKPGQASPARLVRWSRTQHWATCDCGKWIEMGIPCRHIFCVMKYEACWTIPAALINKRWTMDARNVEFPAGIETDGSSPTVDLRRLSRTGMMDKTWGKVRESASKTDEGYAEVMDSLHKLQQSCDNHARNRPPANPTESSASGSFFTCSNIIRDPERISSKGKNATAAAAGVGENATEGVRGIHCGHCGTLGHNIRSCPSITTRNPKPSSSKARKTSKSKSAAPGSSPEFYEPEVPDYENEFQHHWAEVDYQDHDSRYNQRHDFRYRGGSGTTETDQECQIPTQQSQASTTHQSWAPWF